MPKTLNELFELYSQPSEIAERQDVAFKTPKLLSLKTVQTLMEQVPKSEDKNSPWTRLNELNYFRGQLAMNPVNYRIGPGPIEQLMQRGIPPDQIIDQCRSDELQMLISPMYLKCLAVHAENQTLSGSWETSSWTSRFVTEAALAFEPEQAIDQNIVDVIQIHIKIMLYALLYDLDETIFCQTIALAMIMLERAEQQNERNTLGKLCQSIGALFSDIWTVPGEPNDPNPVEVKEWLARPRRNTGIFTGLGTPGEVPKTADCLNSAIAWFQRGLPYRSGLQRGLTYKAIVQTQYFLKCVLKNPIDEALLARCFMLAPELLRKHPDSSHLEAMASIAKLLGQNLNQSITSVSPENQSLIEELQTEFEPEKLSELSIKSRQESHNDAVQDLQRVLRHNLPFALYLRNFDHANEIHKVGDTITEEKNGNLSIVVPQVSYSLVDHKILQLFEEGVIAVCDPALTIMHRLTLIPMLSLKDTKWMDVVEQLIQRCTRVVMLLDELTPGVQFELDLLQSLGAETRTLIVTGHAFRTDQAEIPKSVIKHFPHILDWIDFGFDESYHSQKYKAHGVIQQYLRRYVRNNAKPTTMAWLDP